MLKSYRCTRLALKSVLIAASPKSFLGQVLFALAAMLHVRAWLKVPSSFLSFTRRGLYEIGAIKALLFLLSLPCRNGSPLPFTCYLKTICNVLGNTSARFPKSAALQLQTEVQLRRISTSLEDGDLKETR